MGDNQMELARTHFGPVVTEHNWNTAGHLPEFKKCHQSRTVVNKSTLKNKYSGNNTRVKTKKKKTSCKQYFKGV